MRLTLSTFLSAVAKEGLVALQRKLHSIELPDFTGDFKIKHVGRGHYEFHRWCSLLLGPREGWAGVGARRGRDSPRTGSGPLGDTQWHSSSPSSEGSSGRELAPLFAHETNINEDILTVDLSLSFLTCEMGMTLLPPVSDNNPGSSLTLWKGR